jgi:hypothetical protein
MEYGMILATRGVADEMKENPAFAQEVIAAFNRYRKMTGETFVKRIKI